MKGNWTETNLCELVFFCTLNNEVSPIALIILTYTEKMHKNKLKFLSRIKKKKIIKANSFLILIVTEESAFTYLPNLDWRFYIRF